MFNAIAGNTHGNNGRTPGDPDKLSLFYFLFFLFFLLFLFFYFYIFLSSPPMIVCLFGERREKKGIETYAQNLVQHVSHPYLI
jgi:hypothetical protein